VAESTDTPLDDIDRAIVAHLLRNCRATFADMGASVALSAPAVKRRVDRMVAAGTIRGFTAVIDPGALGWHTEAYVYVFCKGLVRASELQQAFRRIPEVESACTITGSADALVHILARDVQHLEKVLALIREAPAVDATRSEIVLSSLVSRTTTAQPPLT
jgi:DNA-binding Lrp family transcriptional regulator